MANENDQIMAAMEGFKTILVGVEAGQVMQKYIRAYDQFAAEAMAAILKADVQVPPQVAASLAWEMADAMMVERRKREIGGINQELGKKPGDA